MRLALRAGGANRAPATSPTGAHNRSPGADREFVQFSNAVGGTSNSRVQDSLGNRFGLSDTSIEVVRRGEPRWRSDAHRFEQGVQA